MRLKNESITLCFPKKGYKNNEDEFTGATNDLNTAMAEYNKALREGKQIIKDKKANKK